MLTKFGAGKQEVMLQKPLGISMHKMKLGHWLTLGISMQMTMDLPQSLRTMSKQKDVKKDVLKEATLSPEELKQIKGGTSEIIIEEDLTDG